MDRRQRREQVARRVDLRLIRIDREVWTLALDRLLDLFNGYRASKATARRGSRWQALRRTETGGWGKDQLHRLVAAFLEVRFPTVVALNKCDRPSAKERVAELITTAAADDLVPCCARVRGGARRWRARTVLSPTTDGAGALEDVDGPAWCGRLPDGMGLLESSTPSRAPSPAPGPSTPTRSPTSSRSGAL